jgi:tRNA(His) 5'-end guanylyltransferase
MYSEFDKRMKGYENIYNKKMIPLVPILVRVDGKSFHTWTKGLEKPFDNDLIKCMKDTTHDLMLETSALFGYTQSDEISLLFYSDRVDSQVFFNGKVNKLNSVLASMTTAIFNYLKSFYEFLEYKDFALFDCRCWQMPKEEVANYFIWRERDAVRNSINSVGQANFSHKELQGKSSKEIQEMLFQEKGINWNDFNLNEKRGTYLQKSKSIISYLQKDIDKLPQKHNARKDPNFKKEITQFRELEFKTLLSLENKDEVIFNGANPKQKENNHTHPET